MTTSDNKEFYRRLSVRVDALRRAMEAVMAGTTPDHGKWGAFASHARAYNTLAESYFAASKDASIRRYDLSKIGNGMNTVWPLQKETFDSIYADVLILSAALQAYDDGTSFAISEIQDLLAANLRRVIFDKPANEIAVQNAIETLFIGRGFQRSVNYERESGKFRFSGKEFIPDFVFPAWDLALEVKLVREKAHISKCVEEMSADAAAYRSNYGRVLFCVYDLGEIRDVAEFASGLESKDGIRVIVVKH